MVLELGNVYGITTFREAVKCICTALGAFADDDREGNLIIKKFMVDSCRTLTTSDFISAIPADYVTNYTKFSVTGAKGTFVTTSGQSSEVGSTFVIEDTPVFDNGSKSYLTSIAQNIGDYLHSIPYTPCELELLCDPTYECGDRLTLVVPKADGTSGTETLQTLITQIEWTPHGTMKITSGGINPRLKVSDSSYGSSNRVLTQKTTENKIFFYHFTNSNTVTVGENETKDLANVRFSVASDANAMFIATILVDVDVPDVEYTITSNPIDIEPYVDFTYQNDSGQNKTIGSFFFKYPTSPTSIDFNHGIYENDTQELEGMMDGMIVGHPGSVNRIWSMRPDPDDPTTEVHFKKVENSNPYLTGGYDPQVVPPTPTGTFLEPVENGVTYYHNDPEGSTPSRSYNKQYGRGTFRAEKVTITPVAKGYRDGYSNVSVSYSLNDIDYEYLATDKLCKGKHIITVQYPLVGLSANTSNKFVIHISCDNGTATMLQGSLRATIFGQGLAESGTFVGYFECTDSVPVMPIVSYKMWGTMSDEATCEVAVVPGLNVITDGGDNLIADNGDNIITE